MKYELLNKTDSANALRFLFLCRMSDKNGYVKENKDIYCIKQSDLSSVLGITHSATFTTINELMKTGLLEVCNDSRFKVNKKYDIKEVHAVKTIYHKITPREHSKIGKALQLLPYVDDHNILIKDGECMTTSEICNVLTPESGYGKKLFKYFCNLKLPYYGLLGKFSTGGCSYYIVNPNFINKAKVPSPLFGGLIQEVNYDNN